MAKLNDLTGKTFGSWLVLYRNGSTPNHAAIWRCRCLKCGREKDVAGYTLVSGASTKCRSCVPRETLSLPHRKSRMSRIYTAMKQRCCNPNSRSYHNYGGRGITMCNEWKNSPDAFFEWALSHGYSDGLTIERIDVNGNYSPDNCCWIPGREQSKNRRSVVRISYLGNEYTLSDACEIINVDRHTVTAYSKKHNVSRQEAFDHYANAYRTANN